MFGDDVEKNNATTVPLKDKDGEIDLKVRRERLQNQTKSFENGLKTLIKGAVKNLLPRLMQFNDNSVSTKCTSSMMKYISGLTSVRVWAIRMLDATSKPAAGLFEGTVADFGGFDQCLDTELPKRNGGIEFRGQYCAVEARPHMLPTPSNFSMAKNSHAGPLDNIGKEIHIAGAAFNYLKFRLGVCVPSTCSLQDMQSIVKRISGAVDMDIQIPQCYVKEEAITFKPVHIAVISILSFLLLACIFGSIIDYHSRNIPYEKLSTCRKVIICFSAITNFQRLICASKGSEELKALHGLRALSMGWIILGHTYVWINYQLLRSPNLTIVWFNRLDFEVILNGWLSVEPFFFLREDRENRAFYVVALLVFIIQNAYIFKKV
ncbi:nose resistant to fluoxetine protein 6 [Nephila pilipes]|uniref:Nose resistant to fluoxetine protein 6 n=1 Tax=Nephila pilipes TaxID=299642 RepID=A0A8X6QG34_NEPPI|nr:nose resistant to fluoxetine protein 6 [Nephila pilipes]